MTTLARDERLVLPDGRTLAYQEVGAPDGRPVLQFHGWPGSRLLALHQADAADALGVRLICPDRPGVGASDDHRGRTLLDWPADVTALADHLGLDRFAVIGVSGGGPYALACAHRLAPRVHRLGLVSAMGPTQERGASRHVALPTRAMLGLAQRVPDLFRYPVALFGLGILRAPDLLFAQLRLSLSAVDRALLDRPEVNAALRAESQEAFRRGASGLARDSVIYGGPWGFDLADVTVPTVLWHGTDDRNVPVAMGHHLAASLPRCEARILPGSGHFFYYERPREILEAVVS